MYSDTLDILKMYLYMWQTKLMETLKTLRTE